MISWSPLLITTAMAALLGVIVTLATFAAIRRRRWGAALLRLTFALLLLLIAALAATIQIGIQGYRALTHEVVAAQIRTERTGLHLFRVTVQLPDKRLLMFDLAGDELYVDAHVLKWRPFLNVLGLHTSYELDRIAGRYTDLDDERTQPRTVHSLAERKPFNMFDLARRLPILTRLVDAEYGSATFVPAKDRMEYELRVSTSGLLMRRLR